MQLIVLGMHRSGTSVTARLLNMMGAYFSAEGAEMPSQFDNPKGHWERLDVVALNDRLLGFARASWDRVSRFRLEKISEAQQNEFKANARPILQRLDAHRPWMLKDPRLCLTFSCWRPLLELPVCILVHRCPLQIARSLQRRNGIPLNAGIALWERYLSAALQATRGLPKLLVMHEELMHAPVAAVSRLYRELGEQGVQGLRLPQEKEIAAFLDQKLFHHQEGAESEPVFLNAAQVRLSQSLQQRRIGDLEGEFACSPGAEAALFQYELEGLIRRRLETQKRKIRENRNRLEEHQRALREQGEALQEQHRAEAEKNQALALQNQTLAAENLALTQQHQALAGQHEATRVALEEALRVQAAGLDEITDFRQSWTGRMVQPFRLLELALRSLGGRPHRHLKSELKRFYYDSIPFISADRKKQWADRVRRLAGRQRAGGRE